MAKHRKPSNTKKNIRRAATVASGSAAAMAITVSPAVAAPFVTEDIPAVPASLPIFKAPTLPQAPVEPAPVVPEPETVTVQPGDYLAKIAAEMNTDWQTLYETNKEVIGVNPDLIYPGQVYFVGGLPLAKPPATIVEVTPEVEVVAPAPVETLDAVGTAIISNSAGSVSQRAQAAANRVVGSVRGAALITIGGTRSSARDMAGHPSGNALDYMVHADTALGNAIVQYHIDNWDSLGVDYIIWQQRIKYSANGAWEGMENRGSATQNHMDHPHVNYNP